MLKMIKPILGFVSRTKEFPEFSTRKLLKDGSDYFGPYTSMRLVKTLLEFAKQLYPLRTCNHSLTEENIQKNLKFVWNTILETVKPHV